MTDLLNLGLQIYHQILAEPTAPPQGQKEHVGAGSSPALVERLAPLLPLPPYSLCLGFAGDELPVLLDLENPTPGSLLVLGDNRAGKTDFLKNLALSATLINQSGEVRYTIITDHPVEWTELVQRQHCNGCYRWNEAKVPDLLLNAAALVENRRHGRRFGATHLLILDSLAPVKDLDYELQVNLKWLVKNGPAEKVWTFASLNPGGASDFITWQALFPTWIFGHLDMPSPFDDSVPDLGKLHPGQYCLQWNSEWIGLTIPAGSQPRV